MGVNINITKKEYTYVDGATGQEITREQFNQKYSATPMGGLGTVLPGGQSEETEIKNDEE